MIKYSEKFTNQINQWEKLYNDAKVQTDSRKDRSGVLIVFNNLTSSEQKNKLAQELFQKCIAEGKKPYIISPNNLDKTTVNYEDFVVELYNNGIIENGEKIDFGKMLLISEPENSIDSMLKLINSGVVPLIHTIPTKGETPNFCLECDKLLHKISGQESNWLRNNYGDVLDTWNNKYVHAKQNMENAYSNKDATSPRRVLIECAAQHPLKMGILPGEEYEARLNKAIQLYREEKLKGNDVKIYIPGSLHRIEKQENGQREIIQDVISLSKSGEIFLQRNGIPANDILAEEYNKKIMPQGVYNSGDECRVASQTFLDGKFNELLAVVSPGQMLRCGLFYLTFGCIPSFYTAPTDNSYHNPVKELTNAIPNVLIESPSWQLKSTYSYATDKDDEIARNARASRNPSLLPSPEQVIER